MSKRGTDRREGQHDLHEQHRRPAAAAEESRDTGRELRILHCAGAFMSAASMSVEVHGHAGLEIGTDGLEVGRLGADAAGQDVAQRR